MRRSSRSTGSLFIVVCAAAAAAATAGRAGPAQRDPADAEQPGWSAPARPGSSWNDPAPLWTDPRGDQAQQGRTWANPRRDQSAAPARPAGADDPGRDTNVPPREPTEAAAPVIKQNEAAPPRDRTLERPAERGAAAAERKEAHGAGDAPRRGARAPRDRASRDQVSRDQASKDQAPGTRRPVVFRPPPRHPAVRRDPYAYAYAPPQVPDGGAGYVQPRYAGRFAGGPPPLYPLAPPPACPLVIKIGNGLASPARSQIVSGRPYCL